jgi:hypothetical protein
MRPYAKTLDKFNFSIFDFGSSGASAKYRLPEAGNRICHLSHNEGHLLNAEHVLMRTHRRPFIM